MAGRTRDVPVRTASGCNVHTWLSIFQSMYLVNCILFINAIFYSFVCILRLTPWLFYNDPAKERNIISYNSLYMQTINILHPNHSQVNKCLLIHSLRKSIVLGRKITNKILLTYLVCTLHFEGIEYSKVPIPQQSIPGNYIVQQA